MRARKRAGRASRAARAALDAQLGKIRHDRLERNGTPVQRGELVRLKGYGTGDRRMRFVEFVERTDDPDRSYVTVLDTVRTERARTGTWISVRPDQIVRVRRQDA